MSNPIAHSVLMEKGDPNRWVVLALISLFSCSNAIQWVTYAPVATSAKEYFHFTTNQLNMMSTVYMIVYVVGAIFTCATFESWGLRRCVLIGTFLNAIGAILKFSIGLEYPSYLTTIIPQAINSFAQLFVLSTPPLVAAQYFPPKRRAFATAVAATANTVGYAMWLVVPPLIVTSADKHQFQILFGIQLVMCAGVFVGTVFFFKKPQYQPPSAELLHAGSNGKSGAGPESSVGKAGSLPYGEVVEESVVATNESPTVPKGSASVPAGCPAFSSVEEIPKEGSWWYRFRYHQQVVILVEVVNTCKLLCQNRDFMILLGAFSIGTGSIWSFFGVLAQISEPVGVTEVQAGISGAVSVAVATIFAYIISIWVDRTHHYKLPVVICFAGSVLGWLALIVVLLKAPIDTSTMDGLCIAMFIFSGLFQNTAIPICFEFALELTYPLQESVPGALLMAGANLVSLTLMFICSAMMGDGTISVLVAVKCIALYVAVCTVGTVLAIFPRERLGRLEAERRQGELELEEAAMTEELSGIHTLGPTEERWVDEDDNEREEDLIIVERHRCPAVKLAVRERPAGGKSAEPNESWRTRGSKGSPPSVRLGKRDYLNPNPSVRLGKRDYLNPNPSVRYNKDWDRWRDEGAAPLGLHDVSHAVIPDMTPATGFGFRTFFGFKPCGRLEHSVLAFFFPMPCRHASTPPLDLAYHSETLNGDHSPLRSDSQPSLPAQRRFTNTQTPFLVRRGPLCAVGGVALLAGSRREDQETHTVHQCSPFKQMKDVESKGTGRCRSHFLVSGSHSSPPSRIHKRKMNSSSERTWVQGLDLSGTGLCHSGVS
eukprot:gene12947-8803_t